MATEYPPEIQSFHENILRLPAVTEVSSGIESLDDLDDAQLSSMIYAHLPHAAIRQGATAGREGCALLQVEFRREPSQAGWRTLEFLAWFVRDQARGGMNIQLRPFALPPVAREVVQLGESLKFHLELFIDAKRGENAPVLASVLEVGQDLERAMRIYGSTLSVE